MISYHPQLLVLYSTPEYSTATINALATKISPMEIVVGHSANLELVLGGGQSRAIFSGFSLEQAAAVYIRRVKGGHDWLAALLTRWPEKKWLQSHNFGNMCGKWRQYAAFDRAGLPIPFSAYVGGADAVQRAKRIGEILGWPLVAKENRGAHGEGVHLLQTPTELAKLLQDEVLNQKIYVCQQYIPNERDYRLVVIKDEVKVVVERVRQGGGAEWRNNVSLGAERRILDPAEVDPLLKQLAVKAAAAAGLLMAGVDIMPDEKGQYVVLEVNSSPDLNPGTLEAVGAYLMEETTRTLGAT